jgi:plastocyanin
VRHRLTLGLVAATAAVLAGCTSVPDGAREAEAFECPLGEEGCDVNEPVGDGGEMTVRGGEFYFDVDDGIAVTGDVDVTLINEGEALHNVEAIGAADGSEIPEAGPGEEDSGIIKLFPGEWTIICNVPGHQAAGMEATVTVFATQEEADEAEAEGLDPNEEDAEAEGGAGGGGAEGEGETVLEPDA